MVHLSAITKNLHLYKVVAKIILIVEDLKTQFVKYGIATFFTH